MHFRDSLMQQRGTTHGHMLLQPCNKLCSGRTWCKGSLACSNSCIPSSLHPSTFKPRASHRTVILPAHTAPRTTALLGTAMRGLIGHRPFLGSSQLQNRAGLGQCSGSCRVAAIPCPQAQQQRLRLHAAAVDAEVQQQAEAATQLEADVTQHSAAAAGSHVSAGCTIVSCI